LRWMHLRKLVPLTELMEQLGGSAGPTATSRTPALRAEAQRTTTPAHRRTVAPSNLAPSNLAPSNPRTVAPSHPVPSPSESSLKDAFLGEVRAGKTFFYNTVVAQAHRIDVAQDTITFSFLPHHRALREQFEQARSWLESTAQRLAGRRVTVSAVQAAPPPEAPAAASPEDRAAQAVSKRDLKAEAMSSSAVQAMLDVFPAEIRDVEEM
jgi:hypothetical protein